MNFILVHKSHPRMDIEGYYFTDVTQRNHGQSVGVQLRLSRQRERRRTETISQARHCQPGHCRRVRIKGDAHELGNASNYAGSARLALLDHPNARQALHSRITFNCTHCRITHQM